MPRTHLCVLAGLCLVTTIAEARLARMRYLLVEDLPEIVSSARARIISGRRALSEDV